MKFEESVRLCGAMAVLLLCALPALAEHTETQSDIENLKARIAILEAVRGEANTLLPWNTCAAPLSLLRTATR